MHATSTVRGSVHVTDDVTIDGAAVVGGVDLAARLAALEARVAELEARNESDDRNDEVYRP